MTAGDVYTIAGYTGGRDRRRYGGGLLNHPQGLAFDSAGDLYIADTWDNRIEEIPAASGTQWGISMTAGRHVHDRGQRRPGTSGTRGRRTGDLSAAVARRAGIAVDSCRGPVHRRRRQQPGPGGRGGDRHPVGPVDDRRRHLHDRGRRPGQLGSRGTAARRPPRDAGRPGRRHRRLLRRPVSSPTPATAGSRRSPRPPAPSGARSMAADDIYTIAGSATGTAGTGGDGGAGHLGAAGRTAGCRRGLGPNLYIADALNNRVQEVAGSAHTEWGQAMTANDIYTIAGPHPAPPGTPATAAPPRRRPLDDPLAVALDGSREPVHRRHRQQPGPRGERHHRRHLHLRRRRRTRWPPPATAARRRWPGWTTRCRRRSTPRATSTSPTPATTGSRRSPPTATPSSASR